MNRHVVILLAALGLTGAVLLTFAPWRPAPEPASAARPAESPADAPAPESSAERDSTASAPPPAALRPEVTRETADPPVATAPTRAALRIVTDVPGAQVFVDRQFKGSTPLVIEDIAPGPHRLNVSADGFDGLAETIEVEPGTHEITLRLREVRLDAQVDVVHRHGLGSCRGRLVATPAGLRYQSAEGGHQLTTGLLDLEAFEVDYLDNTLRVRVYGRRFDFSDPDGNADRLFVFHRDVERARERLRRGDVPAVE